MNLPKPQSPQALEKQIPFDKDDGHLLTAAKGNRGSLMTFSALAVIEDADKRGNGRSVSTDGALVHFNDVQFGESYVYEGGDRATIVEGGEKEIEGVISSEFDIGMATVKT